MEGSEVGTGESFYIFHYEHSDGNYWVTNDKERITDPEEWDGVNRFEPSGEWRILIIEEKKDIILVDTTVQIPDN